ncbi:MAG: LPP20 family lipoprotein [Helicobacteraceae bacterium]
MKNRIVTAWLCALAGVSFLGGAENDEMFESTKMQASNAPQREMQKPQSNDDDFIIANAPTLKPTNIITVRAIGMGVAPQNTISPSQALAMAKRAAIVDAYRQLGEKLHGIRITASDTIKDAMLNHSVIKAQVYSLVRGADVVETIYENGLCQVEMEVKIDGRRWYYFLANGL